VKNRGANEKQRFTKRPAPVHKLGHFGVCVTNFAKSYEFYTNRFNLFPSELVYTPDGRDITVFYRLGRGKELVDHHCFFFFEGPEYHVHHSSFETHDFDAQSLGHDWLRNKGYKNCWGVGRHIMGSQIFDYWWVAVPDVVCWNGLTCETGSTRRASSASTMSTVICWTTRSRRTGTRQVRTTCMSGVSSAGM
jgi:hypothetical protein